MILYLHEIAALLVEWNTDVSVEVWNPTVGAVRYNLELILGKYQMQNSVMKWTQTPNCPQL